MSAASSVAEDSSRWSSGERKSAAHNDAVRAAERKLEKINAELAKVRHERLQMSSSSPKVHSKRSAHEAKSTVKKKALHHPHLDYVIAEVVYSPYMTKPNQPYPQHVFQMPEKLRSLKNEHQDLKSLPSDSRPFNFEEVKDAFRQFSSFNASFSKNDNERRGSMLSSENPLSRQVSSPKLRTVGSVTSLGSKALSRHGSNSINPRHQTPPKIRSVGSASSFGAGSLPKVRTRKSPSAQSITSAVVVLNRPHRSTSEEVVSSSGKKMLEEDSPPLQTSQSHDPQLEYYNDDFDVDEHVDEVVDEQSSNVLHRIDPRSALEPSVPANLPPTVQAASPGFEKALQPESPFMDGEDLRVLLRSLGQMAHIMHLPG